MGQDESESRRETRTNLQCRVAQVSIECDRVHLDPQERNCSHANPNQTEVRDGNPGGDVHGLWEGYGGARINYQKASIKEIHVIDSSIHTDGIGRFGLCIGIDVSGPKGKRGQ